MVDRQTIIKMIDAGNALVEEGQRLVSKGQEIISNAEYLSKFTQFESASVSSSMTKNSFPAPTKEQNKEDIYPGYPFNGTVAEKAVYIIKFLGRFSLKSEIANKAADIEGFESIKHRFSQLGQHLNQSSGIINRKVGQANNNTIWGIREYLSDTGKIKKEYMVDRKVLPYEVSDTEFYDMIE